MKKTGKLLSIILSIVAMVCALPTTAFAANDNMNADNTNFTTAEFEALKPIYAEYEENSKARAVEIIEKKNIGIAKKGTSLVISGYTYGNSDVKKCGFKEVVIERRKNSSSSWSEYKVYEDLYSSSSSYVLKKSVTVPSGYQYRVTAIHYAKVSLFSTQKISAVTGYLTF